MSKAENRAAAKAYHQEQERKRRELARAEAVQADLVELERLRRYLMFGKKAGEPAHELQCHRTPVPLQFRQVDFV